MGIKNFIKKLIGLFTVPRCPNCGARLEEVPREEENDPIAFKCINCGARLEEVPREEENDPIAFKCINCGKEWS
jgi:DNA-directed RNA polymerase subunit RPC12/RpoP